MPPLIDNTTTLVLDKEDDGILVAQIEVCDQPQRVYLTTAYAFVTCKNGDDEGQVAVVDLATRTVVTTLTVGSQPFNMVLYAPGGVEKYIYVGNIESNNFSIIDIASLTVIGLYPL
jgi:YVTN family beta-propeller protein